MEARLPSEALRLGREYAGSFSLLITDVVMPEMGEERAGGPVDALEPADEGAF
jgi:hypothetical protein